MQAILSDSNLCKASHPCFQYDILTPGGEKMEQEMNNFEIISTAIDHFSSLWRIKCAQPEGTVNPVLDKEIKLLEIKLHAFGVNTDDLKL